jgi:hypothetical protein
MRLYLAKVAPFAAALDLDLSRMTVCHACLSFVSMPLAAGEVEEARSWARRMTPFIWQEGLAEPALAAVRKAYAARVPGAEACLADLEARGGRSVVARAIVLRLAADLAERTRIALAAEAAARPQLELAPPEWN